MNEKILECKSVESLRKTYGEKKENIIEDFEDFAGDYNYILLNTSDKAKTVLSYEGKLTVVDNQVNYIIKASSANFNSIIPKAAIKSTSIKNGEVTIILTNRTRIYIK